MNILIMDDDEKFITSLKEKILIYISEYNDRTFFIYTITMILQYFWISIRLHLLILIYKCEVVDGIAIAEKIRELNPSCYIVFVSARNDLIHSSLQVQPFFFIRKMVFEKDFQFFWSLFQKKLKNFEVLTLSYESKYFTIYPFDILYVEAFDHISCIHTKNKLYYDKHTLTDFYSTLSKDYFLQIHRSIIVNLKYMTSFNSNTICLEEKYKFNIGRSYKEKCKKVIKEFLLK